MKTLLDLQKCDARNITALGMLFPWPRSYDTGIGGPVPTGIVPDVSQVTSQGKKFVIAVCSGTTAREKRHAFLGPIKFDQAYVFDADGRLFHTYSDTAHDSNVTVVSLGIEDTWFVWHQSAIGTPQTGVSKIYIVNDRDKPAVQLRHFINGTTFTIHAVEAKTVGHRFGFGARLGPRFDKLNGTGTDGKTYQPILSWNGARQSFIGASKVTSGKNVLYEVDQTASKRFSALEDGP